MNETYGETDYLQFSDYMYNRNVNDYIVPNLDELIASIPGSVSI